MNENDSSIFALKMRSFGSVAGWGMFIMFVLLPLFFVADIYLSNFFLSIYMVAFIAFIIIMFLWERLIKVSRFNFWLDADVFTPILSTIFPMLSGCIIAAFLIWWWFFIETGVFLLDIVYFICLTAGFLPLYYFLLRYRKRKFKGERYKYARGKSEDIEEVVRKALDSFNFKYTRVMEGSKWTMLVPSYRIEGSEISVKVRKAGRREVIIAMKVQSLSDVPKAREIEKSIDSLIDIVKR